MGMSQARAANAIAQVSRWGRGNFVVTDAQILAALQKFMNNY